MGRPIFYGGFIQVIARLDEFFISR